MVTVDGFFAGPHGEIDWHRVDAEFNEYAIDMLHSADMLLFGRTTYDLMAGYWPSPNVIKNDPIVAGLMNSLPKIVFSKTEQGAADFSWNNTKVMLDIVPEEIMKLKQEPGKDILIFGSGTIVSAFARLGLIDEYRLIVNPVILGSGKMLFSGAVGANEKIVLKLLKTKTFASGNVLLYYSPAEKVV